MGPLFLCVGRFEICREIHLRSPGFEVQDRGAVEAVDGVDFDAASGLVQAEDFDGCKSDWVGAGW